MKKILGAFLGFLFLISEFMPDSFFPIVCLLIFYLLIFWFALKKRMKLLTFTRTTLKIFIAKMICDFFVILPVCVIPFLFINTPYQICFVVALILTFVWEIFLFFLNRKKDLQNNSN